MKINSYQVNFDTTHQMLSADYQKLNVSQNKTTLENGEKAVVEEIKSIKDNTKLVDAKLSAKMQASLIKKISETGQRIEYEGMKAEYEDVHLKTKAIIKADGKELSVDLEANLKRSFVQKEKIVINGREFKDPLVISLDGNMPQLGHNTFSFDIDSDGTKNQITNLKYGSGFLALDKNENGKIDDGSELFGTKSGDGFRDLAAYDDDGNGWIDENDPIFDKLRVWQKTDYGDKLVGIGEVGIGAIFLGNAKTDFTYKSLKENQTQARMRSSGFFVYEDGKAGVISQIDMAVLDKNEKSSQSLKIKEVLENSTKSKGQSIYNTLAKDMNASNETKSKSSKSPLDDIRAQISQLEAKLLDADKKEYGSIQAKIGSLRLEMLSMIQMGLA